MIAAPALLLAAFCAAAGPRQASVGPARVAPAPGAVYERKAGLVVIDVKGSTPLYLAQGNKKAYASIMGVLDRAEAVAAAHEGQVIRRTGDGQLLAFPTFEQALEAAARIQESVHAWRRGQPESPLKLRASAVHGRVLFDGDRLGPEVYGRNVERAFRLAGLGEGGDVAVDAEAAAHPAVRRLASRGSEEKRGDALLLKPRSVPSPAPAEALQPPLTHARMTVAATLFATLADWSATYERHGRRSAYATVKAFHAHVRRAVESVGGSLVKTQGETVMATFVSPGAAVLAAVRIQRRMQDLRESAPLGPLAQAKVGVTYGRILRQDRLEGTDFYGNRANSAARLMHLAEPGEVLASGSLLEEGTSATLLREARREAVALKGFPAPIAALRFKPKARPAQAPAVRRLRAVAEGARDRVVRAP